MFINHLALQMLYAVIGAVAEKKLTDRYSFDDVMSFLKHVRDNQINGEWKLTEITKPTVRLCEELEIELLEPARLRDTLNMKWYSSNNPLPKAELSNFELKTVRHSFKKQDWDALSQNTSSNLSHKSRTGML